MEIYIVVGAVLYWTFAVVVVAKGLSAYDTFDVRFVAGIIAASVFWPITAIVAGVIVTYSCLVASTKQIKQDLHNRKVLGEFERWLEGR